MGANHYLTKPFYMEELVARIYAILRTTGKLQTSSTLDFYDLHLDLNKKRVFYKGEEVILQNKQFNLLEYFLLNKGTILLKEQIYDRIWGIESDATIEIVEVYISNLRKILSKFGYDKYIKTKRRLGICLMINKKVFNETKINLIKINILVVSGFLIIFSLFTFFYFQSITYNSIDDKLKEDMNILLCK